MLLLDTCVLLWLTNEPVKLSPTVQQALADHIGQLYVSAISGFEISQKVAKGN